MVVVNVLTVNTLYSLYYCTTQNVYMCGKHAKCSSISKCWSLFPGTICTM